MQENKQTMGGGLSSDVNESNRFFFFSVRAPTMKIKNYSFRELGLIKKLQVAY